MSGGKHLTLRALRDLIPYSHALRARNLDHGLPIGRRHAEENPAIDVLPQQAAYLLYTSGSTGWPKSDGNFPRASQPNYTYR